jgi:hypothetical protein
VVLLVASLYSNSKCRTRKKRDFDVSRLDLWPLTVGARLACVRGSLVKYVSNTFD